MSFVSKTIVIFLSRSISHTHTHTHSHTHTHTLLFLVPQVNGGVQKEGKMKNLPVPVYLRPLDERDASMKVSTTDRPLILSMALDY